MLDGWEGYRTDRSGPRLPTDDWLSQLLKPPQPRPSAPDILWSWTLLGLKGSIIAVLVLDDGVESLREGESRSFPQKQGPVSHLSQVGLIYVPQVCFKIECFHGAYSCG